MNQQFQNNLDAAKNELTNPLTYGCAVQYATEKKLVKTYLYLSSFSYNQSLVVYQTTFSCGAEERKKPCKKCLMYSKELFIHLHIKYLYIASELFFKNTFLFKKSYIIYNVQQVKTINYKSTDRVFMIIYIWFIKIFKKVAHLHLTLTYIDLLEIFVLKVGQWAEEILFDIVLEGILVLS